MRTFLVVLTTMMYTFPIWGSLNTGDLPEVVEQAVFIVYQKEKEVIIGDMINTPRWSFDTQDFCSMDQKDLHIWIYSQETKQIYYDQNQVSEKYSYWGISEVVGEIGSSPTLAGVIKENKLILEWYHNIQDNKTKYEIYKSEVGKKCYNWVGHTTDVSGKMRYEDKHFKAGNCYFVIPTIKEKIFGGRSNLYCVYDNPLARTGSKFRNKVTTLWGRIKK